MNDNGLDILVPMALIAGIVFMISFSQYLSYRNRKRALLVIEKALQNDGAPDHRVLDAIAQAKPRPFADFRRGLLCLALAIGTFVFSISINNSDVTAVLRGLSALPASLGLTYLSFHFLTSQEKTAP